MEFNVLGVVGVWFYLKGGGIFEEQTGVDVELLLSQLFWILGQMVRIILRNIIWRVKITLIFRDLRSLVR